jgi:uncharacterized membrane protein YcaP (DUF421 family)
MKPEEIKFGDWMRMLMGETPPEFLLEVIFRVFFIFLLIVVSMRLMGRRMAGQLNRTEMVALFSLAAAIGVPVLSPDRGLLPAVAIAIVVVGIGRLVAAWAYKDPKFESFAEDDVSILVKDGVLQWKNMTHSRITKERLFAQLRSESIRHLGEVKRVYIEASGAFTIIQEDQPKPGLSVIPETDPEFLNEFNKAKETYVCCECGHKEDSKGTPGKCEICGNEEWDKAME